MTKTIIQWASLACAAAALTACSVETAPSASPAERTGKAEEAATATTITIASPAGATLANTVLAATGTLLLDARSTVGVAGNSLAVANFGSTNTQIQAGVTVNGNLSSVSSVFFGASPGVITGNLVTTGTVNSQQGAQVKGTTSQHTTFGQTPFSWSVTLPSTNAGPVTLLNGQSQSPAPGAYGAVTAFSGATISLRSGTYFMTSFDAEPGSTVKVDESGGPVFIYDTGTATLRGTWAISGATTHNNLLFVSLGSGVVDVASVYSGAIVAPNGTVNLDRVAAADTAQIFAKQIELFSNETILLGGGFDWTSFCALGDTDGDGTADCTDQCPLDAKKTTPGVCGCGISETDTDHDGIPDCIDQCPNDPSASVPGQCGCPSSPTAAGTTCTDGICSGVTSTKLTCNGTGQCGNASTCAPDPACVVKEWNQNIYWICPGPVTWAQAQTKCDAVAGQSLLEIDSREENAVLADLVKTPSWMGANDQSTVGTWSWAVGANSNAKTFFTNGNTVFGDFSSWAGSAPGDNVGRCGSFSGPPGTWNDANCASSMPYVCKRPAGQGSPQVPTLTCGSFGPDLACPAPTNQPCVPSDPNLLDAGTVIAQVNACLAANCTSPGAPGCAQCVGAAAVPPPGSTCSPYSGTSCGIIPGTEQNTCSTDSDCAAGLVCAVTVASGSGSSPGCTVCDDLTNGQCTNPNRCAQQTFHCGKPVANCEPAYDGGLCGEVVLCPPNPPGIQDPRLNPGSNLTPQIFDAGGTFTPGPDATPNYPPDPACPSPPCTLGPKNGWCTYLVPTQLPPQDPQHSNPGNSGSGGAIQFDFDPNLTFHYDASPLALGESNFDLTASASLTATASFTIPVVGNAQFDILDALAKLTANRCEASTASSHLEVFGIDFLPSSFKFDTKDAPVDFDPVACNNALEAFETTVDRAKKSLKDAEVLLTQYNANKALGEVFPFGTGGGQADAGSNLCEQIAADPPLGFPAGNCPTETPEATIDRFIQFYSNQAKAAFLAEAQLGLDELTVTKDIPVTFLNNSEQQTLFEATFFIGPIPCLLQVQSVENYGMGGNLHFGFSPGSLLATQSREQVAQITAGVGPYANAGISLFVGVGFDIGVASASVGVEGNVTLGNVSAPITAGAGLDIEATPDPRPLPADLAPLANAAPIISPMQYQFFLDYDYRAEIDINQILAGSLSARLEISFLFFSKTWTQKIVDLGNGFSLAPIVLLSGDGQGAAIGSFPWAMVQMPTPFVGLTPLSVPNTPNSTLPDGGPAKIVGFDNSQVEKLFYDSQCTCVDAGAPATGTSTCFRTADCCPAAAGQPPIVCFSDPAVGGQKSCEACRQSLHSIPDPNGCPPPPEGGLLVGCTIDVPAQSCNVDSDCCQGAHGTRCTNTGSGPVCVDNPGPGPS